tara:strand:+ start:433 stop:786 length:354 start_codon:yes stop_codon:yes gene_type:complete
MRYNKRRLRQIIKEEKAKILREMAVDSRQIAAKSMDMFGKIHNAVDQLLMRGMDPIELANELRGLADDVEESSPMYRSAMLENDKASDGFDREEREAAGEYDDVKKKEKKPKAQDMR